MRDETNALLRALQSRPLVLDAAMGTRLVSLGLDLEDDDPALWNLDEGRSRLVAGLHRRDLDAGADALLTNTFGANRPNLARLGMADRLSQTIGHAIREALDAWKAARPKARPLILGSIGPIPASQPGAYRELLGSLDLDADGPWVDALFLETHRGEAAERALIELRDATDLPILVSLDHWPDPPDAAAHRLASLGAAALGVNCVVGMPATIAKLARLPRDLGLPLIAKPSAGLPGDPMASPQSFAEAVPALLDLGVRLVGGCCGTTEAHVAALRDAVDRVYGVRG
jgi:methionine synthase I (cobalamin-dependent)